MTALALALVGAIVAISAVNTADGRPPRATWAVSFLLIGALAGLFATFVAVGVALR